jgi:hypothetical protein
MRPQTARVIDGGREAVPIYNFRAVLHVPA